MRGEGVGRRPARAWGRRHSMHRALRARGMRRHCIRQSQAAPSVGRLRSSGVVAAAPQSQGPPTDGRSLGRSAASVDTRCAGSSFCAPLSPILAGIVSSPAGRSADLCASARRNLAAGARRRGRGPAARGWCSNFGASQLDGTRRDRRVGQAVAERACWRAGFRDCQHPEAK